MPAQELDITLSPVKLLRRCSAQPGLAALDGGGPHSWGTGHALFGFAPRATLRVQPDGSAKLRTDAGDEHHQGDPLALLASFRDRYSVASSEPFAGGVIAALSYDLRHWIERLPAGTVDPLRLPVLYAAAYDWLLVYAYATRRYTVVTARPDIALSTVAQKILALAAQPAPPIAPHALVPVADLGREDYDAAVHAALAYIAAGDVYQVNLAHRFVVANPPPPAHLFTTLQRHPMPFAAFVDAGDFALLSNSPECLLTLRGQRLTTYPIKGTRPRGRDATADRLLACELVNSPKDRAEHVMIVDLERNDLGRICDVGSVHVDELARGRAFPTLYHMISEVSGTLRRDVGLVELLRAMFPGGSVTGAPKIRAMEIIDMLEPIARGFYTGSIGYLGTDGSLTFSLLIRTAIATSGVVTYHAGGGIVADSVATQEYEETLWKAQPFFSALTAP